MEPFGYAFSMHGDTSNDSGGIMPNYIVRKYLWPDEPIFDFVWRNRAHDDYSGISYRGDFLLAAIFPSDWNGGDTGELDPVADQWGADNNTDKAPPINKEWNPAELEQLKV